MRSLLAIATAFAVAAVALPTANVPHVLHEKRHPTPTTVWAKRQAAPASAKIPVRIGMTQRNLDKGHDMLMDVSRHDSPKYGKHYTADEIEDIFAPSKDTVDAVSAWLRSVGIQGFGQSVNKQWMQVDLKVEELESLLKTKYHEFEHVGSGDVHLACDE